MIECATAAIIIRHLLHHSSQLKCTIQLCLPFALIILPFSACYKFMSRTHVHILFVCNVFRYTFIRVKNVSFIPIVLDFLLKTREKMTLQITCRRNKIQFNAMLCCPFTFYPSDVPLAARYCWPHVSTDFKSFGFRFVRKWPTHSIESQINAHT